MTTLSPRAQAIFEKKYTLDGNETWEQCVKRFVGLLTDDKKKQKQFFEFIYNMEGLPGGRGLACAGTTNALMNCYTLNVDDTLESITKTLQDFILVESKGGGVGIDLSKLRGRGAPIYRKGLVKTAKEESCGAVGFAEIYHSAACAITGGSGRKGATLVSLRYDSPDILEFIKAKQDHSKFNSFNISVGVNDEFFKRIKEGGQKEIELWQLIVEGMINNAEPGLLHLDNINKFNAISYLPDSYIYTTNPCGELPLAPYSSCALFSINLSLLPNINHNDFYRELKKRVELGIEILNYMLEKNDYILPENKKVSLSHRRIGLGVFGLAHYLVQNGVRYGSFESLELISKLFETFRNLSYEASTNLTDTFGQFKGFDAEKYLANPFFKDFDERLIDLIRKKGIANCAVNTCAPTGTISQLADTTSGIEPIFELSYMRKDSLGENEIKDPLYESGKYDKSLFVTTNEITPEEHIAVQRTIQKYLDGSISKTINCLPDKKLYEKLSKLLLENMPYLKGITVYVKGSRKHEVLSSKIKKEDMPSMMPAIRTKHKIGKSTVYLFTSYYKDLPKEIFAFTGENEEVGACEDALCRSISTMLRSDFSIKEITKQLYKARGIHIKALPQIIANRLEAFLDIDEKCEKCGGKIVKSEGCFLCLRCGDSKCG